MSQDTMEQVIKQGMAEAEKGNTMMALLRFEEAKKLGVSPLLDSYYGFCIAAERRQVRQGVVYCNQALQDEPTEPTHYLNLARIYLLSNQKALAITTLRKGLKYGHDRRISTLLRSLGIRKEPIIRSLPREHFLNRILGKWLNRTR